MPVIHLLRGRSDRSRSRGQSIVELALVVPILMFLFLAIADFGRIFATMLTVEAAAREAADFGTLYPWQWDPDNPAPPDTPNATTTIAGMTQRACVATSSLPGYVGAPDHSTCTNPTVTIVLDDSPKVVPDACHQVPREAIPCNVVVTLEYDFQLIVPLNINFFGTTLGFPSTLSFDRVSTFAISDFELDSGSAP